MADQKQEITFYPTMVGDKRAPGAYLRRNLLPSLTSGLYPSKDFTATADTFSASDQGIIGISQDYLGPIIINETQNGRYEFVRFDTNNRPVTTLTNAHIPAFASDGEYLYLVENNQSELWRLRGSTLGWYEDFPGGWYDSYAVGGYDGLYIWFVGSDIWRYLPGGNVDPELVMEEGLPGSEQMFIDFYQDHMVIFAQHNRSKDITVYFWDKANTAFFTHRITKRNSFLLGGGVVDGLPILVYATEGRTNVKEGLGRIVVAGWTGRDFEPLNEISLEYTPRLSRNQGALGQTCSVGENYLIFSVDIQSKSNNQPDLNKAFIYKVYRDGAIEVLTEPEGGANAGAHVVKALNGFETYVRRQSSGDKVFFNEATNTSFAQYQDFSESTYITNFLTSPYSTHRLLGLSVSFEKLVAQGASDPEPELNIYFRTSDREAWTLLGNVTLTKVLENVDTRVPASEKTTPTKSQRYQFTKLPDNTALPEFNEIQYKFHSKRGFSLIGAWHEYDYITRNTLK